MKQLMYLSVGVNDAGGTSEDRYATPTHPDGGEWQLVKATWTPRTTLAVHASNYATLALKNGATTLGSLTTNSSGGTAFTANTPQAFTLTGGTALEFTANTDPVEVDDTHAGTPGAAVQGEVALVFERIS